MTTLYLNVDSIQLGDKIGLKYFDFDSFIEYYKEVDICFEDEEYFFGNDFDIRIFKSTGKIVIDFVHFYEKSNKYRDLDNIYNLNHPEVLKANKKFILSKDLLYLSSEIYKIKLTELSDNDLEHLKETINSLRCYL